jgi:hypothetical protein
MDGENTRKEIRDGSSPPSAGKMIRRKEREEEYGDQQATFR